MHKITAKEFTLDDFSLEHLRNESVLVTERDQDYHNGSLDCFFDVLDMLNTWRKKYLTVIKVDPETDLSAKDIWWQMIQLLPSSYNQRRTIFLNYEVLHNIYHDRKDHKIDEWRDFCKWITTLPYPELIIHKQKQTLEDVAEE